MTGKAAQQKLDLSTFTCCLEHILKGMVSAAWTECSQNPHVEKSSSLLVQGSSYVPSWLDPALVLDSILIQLYSSFSFPKSSRSHSRLFMEVLPRGTSTVHQVFETCLCVTYSYSAHFSILSVHTLTNGFWKDRLRRHINDRAVFIMGLLMRIRLVMFLFFKWSCLFN